MAGLPLYHLRITLGRCGRCGRQAPRGQRLCPDCQVAARLYQQRRRRMAARPRPTGPQVLCCGWWASVGPVQGWTCPTCGTKG